MEEPSVPKTETTTPADTPKKVEKGVKINYQA